MVESRLVEPVVAGSNPVGHPTSHPQSSLFRVAENESPAQNPKRFAPQPPEFAGVVGFPLIPTTVEIWLNPAACNLSSPSPLAERGERAGVRGWPRRRWWPHPSSGLRPPSPLAPRWEKEKLAHLFRFYRPSHVGGMRFNNRASIHGVCGTEAVMPSQAASGEAAYFLGSSIWIPTFFRMSS